MKNTTTLVMCALLAGCATGTQGPAKTQLEVREFQTRTFDTTKTNEVLSAVVEAFQDQGFMVKNVVPEVGLVAATKDSDVEEFGQAAMMFLAFGHHASWAKNSTIEATANIKTIGPKTKVRITFQEKVLTNHGGINSVKTIEEPRFYQIFFDKIGKSIFIEKQKLS